MDMVQLTQTDVVLMVALNRPENHNALTPDMIHRLTAVFQHYSSRKEIRVIVLTGNGRSFCAGADINTMRAAADTDFEENVADGKTIYNLMQLIDRCPKPVIGRINGAAIGGGVGLVSVCDMVVAVERAKFSFSETRLGLVPAVISPFVLAKIGLGNGRELFLTGEQFNAQRAQKIGLVQHVVAEEAIDDKVNERVEQLLQAAPEAQAAAKRLVQEIAFQQSADVCDITTNLIAHRRASDEGREGMTAFLQKRKPDWQT